MGAQRDPGRRLPRRGARPDHRCPAPTASAASRSTGSAPGLALLFSFPAAVLLQSESRWAIFVAFVVGLGVLYGLVYGPLAAFWSELFDTRYRYTALSSLYQVSGIVASGFTPLIAAWLVSKGDGSLWLVAALRRRRRGAVSLVCAHLLPETRGRDLDEPWVEADAAERDLVTA